MRPHVEARVGVGSDYYRGVLQQQLASALADTNACRLAAFKAFAQFYDAEHATPPPNRPRSASQSAHGLAQPTVQSGIADHPNARRIYAECQITALPNSMNTTGVEYSLVLPPDPDQNTQGMITSYDAPGKRYPESAIRFGYLCVLTNYDTLPIARVKLSFLGHFSRPIKDAGPGRLVFGPKSFFDRSVQIDIAKIDPGIAAAFRFYVSNASDRYVRLILPHFATASSSDGTGEDNIPFIAAADTALQLQPITLQEKNTSISLPDHFGG